jgi:hypothetical protein
MNELNKTKEFDVNKSYQTSFTIRYKEADGLSSEPQYKMLEKSLIHTGDTNLTEIA